MSKLKDCFVIMPISDVLGYDPGHFTRVYEHLIKPAIEKAGFNPVRADTDRKTNVIMIGILQRILEADMVLCDLSSKNPNVLYELGIRQAFDKPVTLIKDSLTERIFDVSQIRDVEYDKSLRIDNIKNNIDLIAETIRNNHEPKEGDYNSLIKLLKIQPAKIAEGVKLTQETTLILNQLKSLNEKIMNLEAQASSGIHNDWILEENSRISPSLYSAINRINYASRPIKGLALQRAIDTFEANQALKEKPIEEGLDKNSNEGNTTPA